MGEIIGAIVGLIVIWMFFGELITAILELAWSAVCFILGLLMIPFEFISNLFSGKKEEKAFRKEQEEKEAARRRRNEQKAALHDFESMSQLPDDPDLLEEMQADYLKEGDKQRAFVCKMRAQELRTKQHMTEADKASAAGKDSSAQAHLKKAAQQGSPEAAYRLAEALAAKAKTVDDWLEAKEWAEKADAKSYPGARALADTIRTKGLAALNELDRLQRAARNAYDGEDYRAAITLYQQARALGFKDGEAQLGFCYLHIASSVKDYEQALQWFESAKVKESDERVRKTLDDVIALSHYKLGLRLDEADRKQDALKHFRTASDMGHGEAALMTALVLATMATYIHELDEVERYARLAKSRGVESAEETLQLIRDIRSGK